MEKGKTASTEEGAKLLPTFKKSDKTDCSNCRAISVLSITYKVLSNIYLSRFTPQVEKKIDGLSI
jgi:hypothetical protein